MNKNGHTHMHLHNTRGCSCGHTELGMLGGVREAVGVLGPGGHDLLHVLAVAGLRLAHALQPARQLRHGALVHLHFRRHVLSAANQTIVKTLKMANAQLAEFRGAKTLHDSRSNNHQEKIIPAVPGFRIFQFLRTFSPWPFA